MSIFHAVKNTISVPIHPAGHPFILIFLMFAICLGVFFGTIFLAVGIVLLVWCIYFFRNPVRYTPLQTNLVISPADGMILSISNLTPPSVLELEGSDWSKISIFMSVFDVHVNRAPMEGRVIKKHYFPGSFFDASLDKASEKNERLALTMASNYGKKIAFIQVAGLVARRILCNISEGDFLKCGQQYGIIRFGSRVDLWLPNPVGIKILTGQRVYAGETILADFDSVKSLSKVRVE